MRKFTNIIYVVIIICCIGVMSYSYFGKSNTPKTQIKSDPKTTIEFTSPTEILFGTINEGEKREFEYHIRNSGNKPLIIYDVITGCQCTGHEISKKVTLPGDSTTIKLFYDSTKKNNFQSIIVKVFTNTEENYHNITFYGRVMQKKSSN